MLCEACVTFAVSADRFAKAAAEICDPNTIDDIARSIQRPFLLFVTRMGKVRSGWECSSSDGMAVSI